MTDDEFELHEQIFMEGVEARKKRLSRELNPYWHVTKKFEHDAWRDGWMHQFDVEDRLSR